MSQDETEPTRRYKGVHFGNLKEKRAEFTGVYVPYKLRYGLNFHTGVEGPGPADYDPNIAVHVSDSCIHTYTHMYSTKTL